jgi:hypothetical protein
MWVRAPTPQHRRALQAMRGPGGAGTRAHRATLQRDLVALHRRGERSMIDRPSTRYVRLVVLPLLPVRPFPNLQW